MSYSDIDQLLEKYIEAKPIVAAALSTEIIEIKPTEIKSQQSHSIHQLDQYIKNRIGVGTFDEIRKGQTDVLIFGGDINSLNEYLKVQAKIDFTNLKLRHPMAQFMNLEMSAMQHLHLNLPERLVSIGQLMVGI